MVPAPQGSYLWTFLLQGLDMPDLRILAAHAFSLSLLFFGEGTVVESFCFANAETIIFVRLGRLISMGEQGRVYWFCLPLVFMGLLFGNLFLQFENRIVNVNFINFIGPGRWLFPWRFSLPHDTLRLIGLKHIFTVIQQFQDSYVFSNSAANLLLSTACLRFLERATHFSINVFLWMLVSDVSGEVFSFALRLYEIIEGVLLALVGVVISVLQLLADLSVALLASNELIDSGENNVSLDPVIHSFIMNGLNSTLIFSIAAQISLQLQILIKQINEMTTPTSSAAGGRNNVSRPDK